MNTLRHPVSEPELRKEYHYIKVDSLSVDNRLMPLATIKNFLFSSQPNHAERFFHPAFAAKIKEVMKEFKPDVVQLESIYLTTYLPDIKKNGNPVTVLRLHNIEYQVWQRLATRVANPLKRFYLKSLAERIKKFEKDAWQQFDLLVPITEQDAAIVKQSGIRMETTVIPFGIDTNNITVNHDNEQWVAYHIGAMDWLPNAEAIEWFLKEVWPAVQNVHPELKFYFAGRNMPLKLKEINIPNAICAGEVPNADAFIADKKILIVPLMAGGGIRVKILEAMAQGKIIISTAVGMQGIEAIPVTHYLLAETPSEFVKAISWVLEHKPDAENIGRNATMLVNEKYNAPELMKILTEKVSSLIRNN
ncbi:MAG: glycosyltransferase, partial [Bacteroidetes bacterium]|nr:glycosyltransferase [Bacteroidota bacterium]